MTVGELLGRMDAFEFACWEELAGVDPFGDDRADWRSAIVAQNAAFASGVLDRVPPLDGFLLSFDDPEPSPADQAEAVATKVRAFFGGMVGPPPPPPPPPANPN